MNGVKQWLSLASYARPHPIKLKLLGLGIGIFKKASQRDSTCIAWVEKPLFEITMRLMIADLLSTCCDRSTH